MIEKILEKVNASFQTELNGAELRIDIDAIKELKDDINNTINAYIGANASINEKRSVLGLPRLDGEQYDQPVLRVNELIGEPTPLNLGDNIN